MSIRYAVIALKEKHVEPVVLQLNALKMERIAEWLKKERHSLYGPTMEDWKPFNGQSVDAFLQDGDPQQVFYSETELIDNLRDDLSNIDILVGAEIELFFLDVFALFSDWHQNLAMRIDNSVADNRDKKCCLVIPYNLSDEVLQVLNRYRQVWTSVVKGYLLGNFCPVVLRADDMMHLKKFVPRLPRLGSVPNLGKGSAMDQAWGSGQKPTLG